jgi:hypothetical protein
MAILMEILGPLFKSILEVIVHEIVKIVSAPDEVLPDVKPVLDTIEPVSVDRMQINW